MLSASLLSFIFYVAVHIECMSCAHVVQSVIERDLLAGQCISRIVCLVYSQNNSVTCQELFNMPGIYSRVAYYFALFCY